MDDPRTELRDLAEKLADGVDEAWTRLYKLTHLPLLRLLRRSLGDLTLAEEALQATYVTAIERIDRYEAGRGTIDAWLAGIARYKALEARRANRLAPLEIDPVDSSSMGGSGTDEELVALTLDQLDPRYAEVLRRKYLASESLAQIAADLGMAQGTVGTLIHRGKSRFRETYQRLVARSEEPHRSIPLFK